MRKYSDILTGVTLNLFLCFLRAPPKFRDRMDVLAGYLAGLRRIKVSSGKTIYGVTFDERGDKKPFGILLQQM